MNPAIALRIDRLRIKAATRFDIAPEKCHIGNIILEGLLDRPTAICHIDAVTDMSETCQSVASRSMRLANALDKFGLKPGDPVIIMGFNHVLLATPYYACNYMGYSMCCIDPTVVPSDLESLYPVIKPKIIFCQKECLETNKQALEMNMLDAPIVTFDGLENDLENFINLHNGSEADFKPGLFDTSIIPAWLILTSGTTGIPKVAMITFDTLLNGVIEWWAQISDQDDKIVTHMIMTSPQWLSSLVFYASTALKPHIRLQASQPITPQLMVKMINKYKPNSTAWTPYLLARFVQAPEKVCDLSCFKHILVGGSSVEKIIVDEFKKICEARLYMAFGMSELLVGIFDCNEDVTPFGSSGRALLEKYQYRLIDDCNNDITESHKKGELWVRSVKGDAFFKGYYNSPEDTQKVLTEDGWVKTGDIFYKDDNDYYYFVERKKLLIRYLTYFVPPLQIEEIIKKHPGVSEACVVGLPNPSTMETVVAAIMKKEDTTVDPHEIFDLVKNSLHDSRQIRGGLFFVDSFPTTPSGKLNRSKVVEMAKAAQRILPK